MPTRKPTPAPAVAAPAQNVIRQHAEQQYKDELIALAESDTTVHGWVDADVCQATLRCVRALGVRVDQHDEGTLTVHGGSPDLGHEIDLVLGYRLRRQLTLEFVAGRFEPGDAFDPSDAATLIDFTARYSF